MTERSPRPQEMIYQLKVTLRDSKPPIWRRVLVPGDYTLGDLHRVIQVLMDWDGDHLHEFRIAGERYGVPSPEDWEPVGEEEEFSLGEVAPAKTRFSYTYDFGDSWEHVILVEKIVPREPDRTYPLCVKGSRAAPPDDIGGMWSYMYLVDALKHPDEYEDVADRLEWLEGHDPEAFDLERVNRRLRALTGDGGDGSREEAG